LFGDTMIHVYPGMGASSAMYRGAWRSLPDAVFHDWPEWSGERSIGELAERIIGEHSIAQGDHLIGSSLGGIVACEAANRIQLGSLALLGSAIGRQEINRLLAAVHPLVDYLPVEAARVSAGKLPSSFAELFAESDPDFIRNMCKAIFAWEGLKSDLPLLRIHGKGDLVIPPCEGFREMIEGGHMIAMTSAEECLRIIRDWRVRLALR